MKKAKESESEGGYRQEADGDGFLIQETTIQIAEETEGTKDHRRGEERRKNRDTPASV